MVRSFGAIPCRKSRWTGLYGHLVGESIELEVRLAIHPFLSIPNMVFFDLKLQFRLPRQSQPLRFLDLCWSHFVSHDLAVLYGPKLFRSR